MRPSVTATIIVFLTNVNWAIAQALPSVSGSQWSEPDTLLGTIQSNRYGTISAATIPLWYRHSINPSNDSKLLNTGPIPSLTPPGIGALLGFGNDHYGIGGLPGFGNDHFGIGAIPGIGNEHFGIGVLPGVGFDHLGVGDLPGLMQYGDGQTPLVPDPEATNKNSASFSTTLDPNAQLGRAFEKYLKVLFEFMIDDSSFLDLSKESALYVGTHRTATTVLLGYDFTKSSVAIVIPSELIHSEDIGRWYAFNVSLDHNTPIKTPNGDAYIITIDQSRAAKRGWDWKAPPPHRIDLKDSVDFLKVDERDQRIADRLSEYAGLLAQK